MNMRRGLLACGVASTALYALTDLLGGLSYPGYDFSSQAISELSAIGAPIDVYAAMLWIAVLGITLSRRLGPRVVLTARTAV